MWETRLNSWLLAARPEPAPCKRFESEAASGGYSVWGRVHMFKGIYGTASQKKKEKKDYKTALAAQ